MKMLAIFAAAVILQAAPAQAWTGQTAFFMEDFMAAEKLATGKTSDSDEVASLIEKADPAGAEKVFRMLNDRAIEACLPAYRKHYEGLKPEVNSQSDLEKLAAGARPATADCRLNYYVKHWKNVKTGAPGRTFPGFLFPAHAGTGRIFSHFRRGASSLLR